ncbi:coiled-coil and C2 domain-containing protein 1B isoform X2 [Xenopus laevis]|nr:coiled-coil and C2 domain-containing protein 1B isoform X2 [Xenopus laevis]
MLGRKLGKKTAQAKGRGAAAAKELGLFVDFSPEDMMLGIPDDPDDGDLEAELAALTGVKAVSKPKPKGKAPLPMEEIEKMAQDCMTDMTGEDDDDDLEEDEELLAELQDVVGEEEEVEQSQPSDTEESEPSASETQEHTEPEQQVNSSVAEIQHNLQVPAGGMLQVLEERIGNYKEAISNAKLSNESAKARRYERGLKTLESMLSAARQGRTVIEADIPPPVACGKPAVSPTTDVPTTDTSKQGLGDLNDVPMETTEAVTNLEKPEDPVSKATTNDGGAVEKTHVASENDTDSKTVLLLRQRDYKLAALKAKQTGDIEKAKEYMKISKKFSVVLEALESGQPVDLSNMPAAPEDHEAMVTESKIIAHPTPAPPVSNILNTQGSSVGSLLQALQQRMEKYKSAAQQAKSSGDDRKARMHERIAKQYQDTIRAQKAGRQVNLAELPVPPGFPPLPGMEQTEEEGSVEKALEAAQKLAKTAGEDVDDDEDECQAKPPGHPKPTQLVKPLVMPAISDNEERLLPIKAPVKVASEETFPPAVQEQLEFLEHRKKQYRKAALQAKQKNDLEQAKQHMRVAHTLQVSIDQVKSGKLVDISKVPSLPDDEESDFVVVEHEDIKSPQNSEDVYNMLMKLLHEQHEKCIRYSKQFTQMGNVAETTRFENMAEDCKKNCEILQLSQAQGLDPPPYHFEDKTLKIVRVFSELSSTEMLLIIVRGINLPAPSGVAPNDLDAYVKFEFPYPSSEQPQKNKTLVIKNTNSPEYEQSFKLNINRNHRGFKRVIQTKGIKFEIFHKGFFLVRSDKQVGSASVKLDKLETQCEIREIVEVFDGRKPTGGKLEIKVRLRDPLNGQDLQVVTEKWLVMGHVPRKKVRLETSCSAPEVMEAQR